MLVLWFSKLYNDTRGSNVLLPLKGGVSVTNQELYKELLRKLSNLDFIKPEDIPGIDLYMDQVTTFMNDHLADAKRREDDKILTKTMINNYAKINLLPPPVKKKYSKEHMLLLIFIYYMKSFLSITDIQELFSPLTSHFGKTEKWNLEDIYSEVVSFESEEMRRLLKDIHTKFKLSQTSFQDAPKEEQEELQLFAFICMLGFDVYLKKRMIETIIDLKESRHDK